MQNLDQLQKMFYEQAGGEFIIPPAELAERLNTVKAFLFDWDGVFNNGFKQGEQGSGFSEADSMGTNLLRFGYWLQHNQLPFVGIVTGEQNPSAIALAKREHFDALYFKTRNKQQALDHLAQQGIAAEQVAFCFDDVLDLPIATACRSRFLITRKSSPLFNEYLKKHQLADYISGQSGGDHAVREVCELILGLAGQYDNVVKHRSTFSNEYQTYLQQRNSGDTAMYTVQDGVVKPVQV